MRSRFPFSIARSLPLLWVLWGSAAQAQDAKVRVVFVEPADTVAVQGAQTYRRVTDAARLRTFGAWLNNESARMALDLYARAWALSTQGRSGDSAVYFVALKPGGNQAAVGFRLVDDRNPGDHARTPFIMLAPQDWAFTTTFLHETGHVVLSLLNGGEGIPRTEIAAISHTTAALTDRGTAFDEGFAIHLETLEAHLATDPFLRERYHHQKFLFGVPDVLGEFHRPAGDLLSFSQTVARYYEVRENNFAFSPAWKGPDYLRVQLEKSRDFASLRDANQLLQSEGFYASFFFSLLVRGQDPPTPQIIRDRQQRVLTALSDILGPGRRKPDDPFLLLFIEAWLRRFPAESNEVIDLLCDLSRGVFVDRQARTLWRDHYLGALRLDLTERSNTAIEAARARWRTEIARDPRVLYQNLGPQIRVEVPGVTVTLVAFGDAQPLSFDLNTAEEGVMRLVPGISEAEVTGWMRARDAQAFASIQDFQTRSGLRAETLSRLTFR